MPATLTQQFIADKANAPYLRLLVDPAAVTNIDVYATPKQSTNTRAVLQIDKYPSGIVPPGASRYRSRTVNYDRETLQEAVDQPSTLIELSGATLPPTIALLIEAINAKTGASLPADLTAEMAVPATYFVLYPNPNHLEYCGELIISLTPAAAQVEG